MDKHWVNEVLEKLAHIGRTPSGGSCRLAFSKEDFQARSYVKALMEEAGLSVREDAFGNIIGRLEGTDPNAAAVGTGSHIDTVPNGGHFDGMVGCIAGLAAIRRIRERGPLKRPLELIVFQMEESSRFSLATFGSKVMAGKAPLAVAREQKDKEGVSLPDAMREAGYDFENLASAVRQKGELCAFVEMHIEQSANLDEENLAVGIVTAIAAPIRSHIAIEGKASHSGGTPMNNRRDALVCAADVVLAVRAIGNRFARHDIVTTVGNLVVTPGAINVVPGKVELWVDLRGTDRAVMDEAQAALRKAAEGIAATHGLPLTLTVLGADSPVRMSPPIIDALEQSCRKLGLPIRRVISGAGHDTMNMAELCDVGMIFVRNKDGLSHNPQEHADINDIMAGIDLLTETLQAIAQQ